MTPPASESAPPAAPPHIVSVDNKKNFTSSTLPAPALNRLASVFKSIPWYRDRWSHRTFRRALLHSLHTDAAAGLVVLGPGVPFTPPLPFTEAFEPVELGAADERLKILSGDAPTRQEVQTRRALWVVLPGVALLFLAGAIAAYIRARPQIQVLAPIAIFFAIVIATLAATIRWALGWRGRWYLLPAAVAIIYRRKKPPLKLLTRFNTCALIRYVNAGKTVVLALELLSRDSTRSMTSITQREAVSFLAAWQSPHAPPDPDELTELPG